MKLKSSLVPPIVLNPSYPFSIDEDGIITISLPVQDRVIFYSSSAPPSSLSITSSPGDPSLFNYWGFQPVAYGPVISLSPCAGLPTQRFIFEPQVPNVRDFKPGYCLLFDPFRFSNCSTSTLLNFTCKHFLTHVFLLLHLI